MSTTLPVPVAGGHTFASVSAGSYHACGRATDGQAWCWGQNDNSELGDGTMNSSGPPVAVDAGLVFAELTAAKNAYSCGVTTDGGAFCWGGAGYGGLGVGGPNFRVVSTPMALADGGSWKSVSKGYDVNCGLRTDGTAWCWGYSQGLRFGDATTISISSSPMPVALGKTFTSLGVSRTHTCGLDDAGTAWCWGQNSYGRLGDGTNANSIYPVAVAGGLTFTSIDVGWDHTCGIATDGFLYCWGVGTDGRLGDGTGMDRWVPTRVSGQ
jgi:alpha-tubulin suppressor-like RCC1 family protein